MTNDTETGNGGHAKNSTDRTPNIIRMVKHVVKSRALIELSGNAVKLLFALVVHEDDLFNKFFNDYLSELSGLKERHWIGLEPN